MIHAYPLDTQREISVINMNIDERALRAWVDREAAIGHVLRPGEDCGAIGEVLLHGYAHDDCVEVAFAGPLRIEAITQEAFFAGEYAPRGDVVDTYYSVEPVGWAAADSSSGPARSSDVVRSMWIFGPEYRLGR